MEFLPPLVNQTTWNVGNFDYQDDYLTFYTGDQRYSKLTGTNTYFGWNTYIGDVNVQGNLTATEASINNSLAVSYNVAIANNLNVSNNITSSGNLLCKNITCESITSNEITYSIGCFINSWPIIKSSSNVTLCSNLGINGNNAQLYIFPKYKINIFNGNNLLFSSDNSLGSDVLNSTIVFILSSTCTKISLYKNSIEVI